MFGHDQMPVGPVSLWEHHAQRPLGHRKMPLKKTGKVECEKRLKTGLKFTSRAMGPSKMDSAWKVGSRYKVWKSYLMYISDF